MTQKDFCRKYGFSFRKFDSRRHLIECCLTLSRLLPINIFSGNPNFRDVPPEVIESIIEELETKAKQIKADFEGVKNES